MLILISLVPIVVLAVYWYFSQHLQYWKRRGVPGPTPQFFFGNWKALENYDDSRFLVFQKWSKMYGSYYGIYEGITKTLVVSDVEMLQDMFVRKFENFYSRKINHLAPDPECETVNVFDARGARWKRLRMVTAANFTSNALKKMSRIVADSANVAVSLMQKYADSGESFSIYEHFAEYTLDIISRIALGQKGTRQFNNPLSAAVKSAFTRRINNVASYLPYAIPVLGPLIKIVFDLTASRNGYFVPQLYRTLGVIVNERKRAREARAARGEEQPEPEDTIDLLLEIEDDVDIEDHEGFNRQTVKSQRKLTTQEIVAQCVLFLLAGFDTTGTSLTYIAYLLATHPDVQQKAIEEIDAVCGSEDEISFESLSELKYLEAIAKEELRLFPLGAIANSRLCMKTTTLGNVEVEKGINVAADPWTVHRSKEIWGDDADEFVPERWDDKKPRHPLAWFPFGAGPRICAGMRLALIEEKILLVHILRRFEIVAGPDTEKELILEGSITTVPRSVTVYLKRRQPAASD